LFYLKILLVTKIPEQKSLSINIQNDREHIEQRHTHYLPSSKPSTREVAMQHIVENEKPPPLPPKQRQQRDVAISHTTEYDDDDEKQTEIVRRKLEEIKHFYTERIHFLEDRILEQEKDIDRLNEPKKQRHVNTQCQPTMQDRALVTDTFRSGIFVNKIYIIYRLIDLFSSRCGINLSSSTNITRSCWPS
jgi:hypothetical protein